MPFATVLDTRNPAVNREILSKFPAHISTPTIGRWQGRQIRGASPIITISNSRATVELIRRSACSAAFQSWARSCAQSGEPAGRMRSQDTTPCLWV